MVFNEAYSMKISPDTKVVCVPEGLPMGEDLVLLKLEVSTDPAAPRIIYRNICGILTMCSCAPLRQENCSFDKVI